MTDISSLIISKPYWRQHKGAIVNIDNIPIVERFSVAMIKKKKYGFQCQQKELMMEVKGKIEYIWNVCHDNVFDQELSLKSYPKTKKKKERKKEKKKKKHFAFDVTASKYNRIDLFFFWAYNHKNMEQNIEWNGDNKFLTSIWYQILIRLMQQVAHGVYEKIRLQCTLQILL